VETQIHADNESAWINIGNGKCSASWVRQEEEEEEETLFAE